MLSNLIIEQVIISQQERLSRIDTGLPRLMKDYSALSSHALIISGIRRCGKSTLLHQLIAASGKPSIYLNLKIHDYQASI